MRGLRARQPYDKDTWLNLAFYCDEQYVEWASDASVIRRIPRSQGFENIPRPTSNKIMHFVAQEHAMALQSKPTVDVLPATDDPIDFSNASVALSYLRWLAEPQVADFDAELSDATLWALAGGEGYLKWTYNAVLERPDILSVSPLDLVVDPYCKRFKQARYVIHTQFMDVEQVYDLYSKEIKPSQQQTVDELKATLMREMGYAPALDGTLVSELWMKPTRRYPNGLFVVWSGREFLVDPIDFPYEHGELPFTQIGSVIRPGCPHYTCAVKYLRSGQRELNKYHAQRIMIREAFSNPKWWIPNELELDALPDDSQRQILRGHSEGGTLKPEIITPQFMADNNDGAWLVSEMQDTVGIHEVSQGDVPGRVEAAQSIELLRQSDISRLSELTRTTNSAISNGFWQCLMLAKQYVPAEMMVQTYSRDGLPEAKAFKAADIKPGMRVRVTDTTGLSSNRVARQQQVIQLFQMGIISDPETAAELMEVPSSAFTPAIAHDIRLARNENLQLNEKIPIVPNSWDNHAIHLREHNNERKTSEYALLPDEAKMMYEMHCDAHEQLEINELKKFAMKQAIMAGALVPPTGGTPPGPGNTESQPPSNTE